MTTTTASKDMLNKPNGDLKAGDRFIVTAWCGEMETYTLRNGMTGEAIGEPIKRPTGGAVYEVQGIDYPHVFVKKFEGAGYGVLTLDMRCFEARMADSGYAAAVILESSPVHPCPCEKCAARRAEDIKALTPKTLRGAIVLWWTKGRKAR